MRTALTERAATRLRAEMGARRMTGVALAQLLGVTAKTASKLARGVKEWTFADADNVSRALGIPIEELLADTPACPSMGQADEADAT